MSKFRDIATRVVEKVQPIAKVAERVATIAVHLRKPTVLGIAGAAASGLTALHDHLGNAPGQSRSIDVYTSRDQTAAAVEAAGASVARRSTGTAEWFECQHAGAWFAINGDGSITTSHSDAAFLEWLRQALDRVLPAVVDVRRRRTRGTSHYETCPRSLTTLVSAQAATIWRATAPLLDGGRCVLLDGKPGVGKTTMAQIIARESGLGRCVLLDGSVLSRGDQGSGIIELPNTENMREALALLSPGVIVVDDVDKIQLTLAVLEAIRGAARLVVLTANNGAHDAVLDGALTRAGRVDEVFTIEPSALPREAPLDRLTDAEWAEVSQWPVAYLVEVRKRLTSRPDELRLDDLRARLTKKTRSGDQLL